MARQHRHLGLMLATVGVGAVLSAGSAAALAGRGETTGTVLLKHEGGMLLLSEAGRPFERLDLGSSAAAQELLGLIRQLQPEGTAIEIPLDHRMVAGGGASVHKARPSRRPGKPAARG